MAFLVSTTEWIDAEILLDLVPELKDKYSRSTIRKWESIALVCIAYVNIENIDLAVEEFSYICIVRFVGENGELQYLGAEKTMCEQIEEFDNTVGAFHEKRDMDMVDLLTNAPLLVQMTSSLNHGKPCKNNEIEEEEEGGEELWAFL